MARTSNSYFFRNGWMVALFSVVLLAETATAQAPSGGNFLSLGTLGGTSASVGGVSADGSVIAGTLTDSGGQVDVYRWTLAGGVQDLGTIGVLSGPWVNGISADGSTIVGVFNPTETINNEHVFRWTEAGGFQDLGTMGNSDYAPCVRGVSADGSVIVGMTSDPSHHWYSYRWTQNSGAQYLPQSAVEADAVSADGSIVVGWSDPNNDLNLRAYRWTAAGGLEDLGTMGGETLQIIPDMSGGISADGSVVVGSLDDAQSSDFRVYRWTQIGGFQDLGTMGGTSAVATGVSADGSKITGYFYDFSKRKNAFLWTPNGGPQDLGTMGGTSAEADKISGDGSVIVGTFVDSSGKSNIFRLNIEN